MTTEDFEDEVRAALRELVPQHEPVLGLGDRVSTAAARARRRRRVRLEASAAALAAIVTVGGIGWLTGSLPLVNGPSNRGVRSVGPVPSPPPVDVRGPHIVLTPSALPPSGGDIALIVANPGSSLLNFGLTGKLDRWDGSRWMPYRTFDTAPTSWASTGSLHGLGESVAVLSIGLGAAAHGYGPAEWVRVSGLPVGYYRLSQGGASGVLEIREASAAPVPLRAPGAGFLEISGTALPGTPTILPGTPTEIRPLPIQRGASSATGLGALTGPARLERLEGREWVPIAALAVEDHPKVVIGDESEFVVRLPALELGIYRLSRHASAAGDLYGLLWVLPRLTPSSASP